MSEYLNWIEENDIDTDHLFGEIEELDITQGYQPLPKNEFGFEITPTEEADEDCIVCWGDGDVQCCAGEHYYTDTCYCVLLKYWNKVGNLFMVDGYKKLLANVIKLKTI